MDDAQYQAEGDAVAAEAEAQIGIEAEQDSAMGANPIHGIREDGTVEGYEIETYFRPALRYEMHEGEEVVRLILDDDAGEIVTALPKQFIREMLDCFEQ